MHTLANTITPLMGLTFSYLVVANLLIGIGEGVVIGRVFKATNHPIRRAVIANYLSAWVGYFLLLLLLDFVGFADWFLGNDPLPHLFAYSCILLVACFVLSVLIEWPVVHFAFGPPVRRLSRSFLASVAANTASYAAIILLLAFTGLRVIPFSPAHTPSIVEQSTIAPLPQALLVWVDPSGRWLAADLRKPDDAIEIGRFNNSEFAGLGHSELTEEAGDLTIRVLRWFRAGQPDNSNGEPPRSVASILVSFPDLSDLQPVRLKASVQTGRRGVVDWRSHDSPNPVDRRYDYDWYRLSITARGRHLNFETPGLPRIEPSQPYVLPDGRIIFGYAMSVWVYDPPTHTIARITRGDIPVVIPLVPPPTTQPN